MIQKTRQAYLECECLGADILSESAGKEYILRFKNFEGNYVGGYFSEGQTIDIGNGKKLLLVNVDNTDYREKVFISFLEKMIVFGNPPIGRQIVKIEQIIYKDEFEKPN
ncbi:MAG: hypothetical protein AABX93_01635 [Nanoarchaeota archaeon]